MSWKVEAEFHSHEEDDELENGVTDWNQHVGCVSLICDECMVPYFLDEGGGIIAHWDETDRETAMEIAREDDWYGWYVSETGDIAYCHGCRGKVSHHCSYAFTDDPCDVCEKWPQEHAS